MATPGSRAALHAEEALQAPVHILQFRGLVFRGLGFQGFRVSGFRANGFRGLTKCAAAPAQKGLSLQQKGLGCMPHPLPPPPRKKEAQAPTVCYVGVWVDGLD